MLRGATIDNILDFEKDFKNLKTFKLEQNYRSTHHIVEAANEVITYNKKQIRKTIWTDKIAEQRIKILKTQSDQEEAKRVADIIMEHKNRYHLKNKDFAILYRTNSQSRPFEEALRRINLTYRVYGGMSFYQRKEVKDVIAYLRLIVNQNDDEALRRIINIPRRGIGDTTVEKMGLMASEKGIPLWQVLPQYEGTAREKNALNNFTTLINAFISREKKANAYEIAIYIVKQSGLLDVLKQDTSLEGLGRLENVNALMDAISEFTENDEIVDEIVTPDKSLSTYLQNIALVTDADNSDPNADVVTLMSVHSAKGLEFKSVIVGGLEEDLFPSFMSKDTPEGMDEERRLFYVAITRAEKYLTLAYATSRYRHGQMKYAEASRFLDEINTEHLDGMGTLMTAKRDTVEKAKISGNYNRATFKTPELKIDPSQFKPSPSESIQAGMTILHLRFGEGKVVTIEGGKDNPIASIHFGEINETKKIALKFAKLQIM